MTEKIQLNRDLEVDADGAKYDMNSNVLVIGASGSGKTVSVVEPMLLGACTSSFVVPVVKRELVDRYIPYFKEKGYIVLDLNLVDTKASTVGYDPLKHVENELELLDISKYIYGGQDEYKRTTDDPYWTNSTAGVIAALMGMAMKKNEGDINTFLLFLKILCNLEFQFPKQFCVSNMDEAFIDLECEHPESVIPKLWKNIEGLSERTAACIISMLNSAINPFLVDSFRPLFEKEEILDIADLGRKKTVLFITCPPASVTAGKLVQVLYSQLFSILFREAEKNGGQLAVPVHIICDDLVGTKIEKLPEYISYIRASGIRLTMCIQAISQLEALYGEYGGSIIRNNCDTQIFLGNMDKQSCHYFASLLDVPDEEVMFMPTGSLVLIRKGMKPMMAERYHTMEDARWKKLMEKK